MSCQEGPGDGHTRTWVRTVRGTESLGPFVLTLTEVDTRKEGGTLCHVLTLRESVTRLGLGKELIDANIH